MKNKTIVHLITGLGGGGAEHMVLKLAIEAKKKNIRTIVIPISNINTIEKKFRDAGLLYHFLNINSITTLFKGLKKLSSILKDENGLVMHCHMFHALLVGVLFRLFFKRIPIVFTLHNTSAGQWYRIIFLILSKPFRNIDVIFSKSGSQSYLKNCTVIPNGLDIGNFEISENRRLSYSKNDIFHFLFLGSLTEQKNPLGLLNLVNELLNENYSNFVIDVVGDGPLRNSLEVGILEKGYQEKIILHGFSNKVITFLKESHCLIMPSHWEGMPVVILEAGAARLPIISTPVGSIPDIVDEESGYIVNLANFSNAMLSAIKNYENALEKSENFYKHVLDNYSIQEVFRKHFNLYNSF